MASIDRSDVESLIVEGYSDAFLNTAQEQSAALAAFNVKPMGTKTERLPVMASKPEADFVGEWSDAEEADNTGAVKPTSKVKWGNKQIVAEEVAVIVPIHESILEDASEDILSQVVKEGGEAIARRLDGAVFHGVRKPTSWSSLGLEQAALDAEQVLTVGADAVDLFDAISQADEELSDGGFDDPVVIARKSLRAKLRNQRDKNGAFLNAGDVLADYSPTFTKHLESDTTAFVVDKGSVVMGLRSDIRVKILDQATVGGINLAETDQIAVRFYARFGYALKDNAAVYRVNNTLGS